MAPTMPLINGDGTYGGARGAEYPPSSMVKRPAPCLFFRASFLPIRRGSTSLVALAVACCCAHAGELVAASDHGAPAPRPGRCGWEADDARVSEIVVEVFADAESSSSHILGYGPAEVAGRLQHVTLYFSAVGLDTIRGMSLRAWAGCAPIGAPMPCAQLMTSGSEQSGELLVYANSAWKGGHDNYVLVQLFDTDNALVAQGESSFVLHSITNKTEGLIEALADELHASASAGPHTCSPPQENRQGGVRVGDEGGEGELRCEGGHSAVQRLEWEQLACAQPRAPLRVYRVSMAQWSRGQLHLWLPPHALQRATGAPDVPEEGLKVGMARLFAQPLPAPSTCHPHYPWPTAGSGGGAGGAGGAGARTLVALLPVLVTAGSIEHLGHFFLDYLANIYRMQQTYLLWRRGGTGGTGARAGLGKGVGEGMGAGGGAGEGAEGSVDEEAVEWLCLVDDMRDSLQDLPRRKFYPLLRAVCPQMWRSLGELPDKACLADAVVAFGGLETIRSRDSKAVPGQLFLKRPLYSDIKV